MYRGIGVVRRGLLILCWGRGEGGVLEGFCREGDFELCLEEGYIECR